MKTNAEIYAYAGIIICTNAGWERILLVLELHEKLQELQRIKIHAFQNLGKLSSRSTSTEIACKTNKIALLQFSTLSRPQLEYKIQFCIIYTQKDVSQLKKVQSSENDE